MPLVVLGRGVLGLVVVVFVPPRGRVEGFVVVDDGCWAERLRWWRGRWFWEGVLREGVV